MKKLNGRISAEKQLSNVNWDGYIKKHKEAKILPEDVPAIVKAEVDYELSLEEGDLS